MNDIAVIVLENDLLFDKFTGAVSLPEEDDMLYTEGSLVTVVGWGLTEEEHTSHVLQVGDTRVYCIIIHMYIV